MVVAVVKPMRGEEWGGGNPNPNPNPYPQPSRCVLKS